MRAGIVQVTLVVRDYDEALAFYTRKLGFECLEDTDLGGGKRWVRVRPAGSTGATLLLARAADDRQRASVGNQTGGRVAFLPRDRRLPARPCGARRPRRRVHRAAAARGVRDGGRVRGPLRQPLRPHRAAHAARVIARA